MSITKNIFDVHTHLNDETYEEIGYTTKDLVDEAMGAGVTEMCCVGFDVKSSKKAILQASKYQSVYAAVGIHPNEAHKTTKSDLEQIEIYAHGNKVVAIGEIGLDYFYSKEHKEVQKEVFKKQIEIALKTDKVVMLHIRDENDKAEAYDDAIEILKQMKVKRCMVHCFTQGIEYAKKFTDLGYYISIPGVITFKNAKNLNEAVKATSLNKILVETDAPYLAPEPYRGQLNQPKFISSTVEHIAKLKNISSIELASITRENAKKLFKLN